MRITSGRIVEMPAEIAAAALLLIQNRQARWVETRAVDANLTEGARRSLGGLVEKLLAYARPQVLVLEQVKRSRFPTDKGPLVVVRMTAELQERIADLVRLVKDRGLQAAMSLSADSVVGNALRLRAVKI